MPAGFTATLATRLDELTPLAVAEAEGGEVIEPNHVWIAPGDFHMRVRRDPDAARIVLDQQETICGTRPAADALFPSVAEAYGRNVVGVVLTGMGRDGAEGLEAIRAAGGRTMVQDRVSSVVYGMPGRALEIGSAERTVSLKAMPEAIVKCLESMPRSGAEKLA
jgi:two-component system chemotaxis response regulator CheB